MMSMSSKRTTQGPNRKRRFVLSAIRNGWRVRTNGIGNFASKWNGKRLLTRAIRKSGRALAFKSPEWITTLTSTGGPSGRKLKRLEFLNPFNLCRWMVGFGSNWLFSRSYSSLLVAVPSFAFGISLLAICLLSRRPDPTRRVSLYGQLLDRALHEKDYDLGLIAIRNLVDARPDNLEFLYHEAIVAQLRGDVEFAVHRMETLALDHGHGMAAMWIVSQKFDLQKLKGWSRDQHTRFRKWMDIALSGMVRENSLSAKVLMFSYLAEIGAFGEANRYISEVVPARPELALAAATLCRSQHDELNKIRYVRIAKQHFETELMKRPSDVDLRVNLGRTLMVDERFEEAAKLLNDGFRLTQDRVLAKATAEALLIWSNRLGEKDANSINLPKRLQILSAALGVAPNDPTVTEAIVRVVVECRSNRDPRVAELRESILQSTNPASTHFIRGTIALLENRFEEAKSHLERASQKGHNYPAILNNLAVATAESKEADLEQALQFSNLAVGQQPTHPYFLETRGQIYVKLGRWQEAIVDLEGALSAKELKPQILPNLAKAYRGIGSTEMAIHFEKLAMEKN